MPQDPLCRESRALIAAAKETGCLVDARSVPGTRYTLRTGESEVRLVQKGGQAREWAANEAPSPFWENRSGPFSQNGREKVRPR